MEKNGKKDPKMNISASQSSHLYNLIIISIGSSTKTFLK